MSHLTKVIMRRGDFNNGKHTGFYGDWQAYKNGFGDSNDEFWMGLEQMHRMTANSDQSLRIDLESFEGERLTLEYQTFRVGDERSGYELNLADPVDELEYANQLIRQNGAKFATKDKNGGMFDCPQRYEAGWWFVGQQCHTVLLTGSYHENDRPLFKEGIQWPAWRANQFLRSVQMKIKPKN
jgi:ficolin